jgi:hypothetical protein
MGRFDNAGGRKGMEALIGTYARPQSPSKIAILVSP